MKNFLLLLVSLLSFTLTAQEHDHSKCATMHVFEQQLKNDPSLRESMEAIERHTAQYLSKPQLQTRSVITIPVVVHVVWRQINPVENISDAQVMSQIEVLNKDFRKLNTDASSVPAPFRPLAADIEVQFCLAARDPNGNPTNGIIHYESTRTTNFGTADNVKNSLKGGADAWNSSQYLNIWVCAIGGGVLGYAQFPGGNPSTDGIVVDYKHFGNFNTQAPYNLGRTATHEVGHWLNLRHIWGDANCGNDFVDDTPTQQTANRGCPTFPRVTCDNGPNGDMFMNYMDYTNDACMYMFTNGQKNRMRALFGPGGFRASLLSSQSCEAPIGGGPCNPPTGLTATNITNTSATVSWNAVSNAINYTLRYRPLGGDFTVLTVNGTSQALSNLNTGVLYEFQVRSNCSVANSDFSPISSFQTGGTGNECSDNFEPNNLTSQATPIPVNTPIFSMLASRNDIDHFSFNTTTSQPDIVVTLTDLPANYDLRLLNAFGNQVGSSTRSGLSNERIAVSGLPVGTYIARVTVSGLSFSNTRCYTLTASIGSSTTREITVQTDGLRVTPNPANDVINVQWVSDSDAPAFLTVSDLTGRVVLQSKNWNVDNNTLTLDTRNLSNGMYIISMRQGEITESRKLVISHH